MILHSDQLKTGSKPAPGELALVQAVINTIDLESGTDDLADPRQTEQWMVRFGLLDGSKRISKPDWQMVIMLREGLRQALIANGGMAVSEVTLESLNRLVAKFNLTVTFRADGKAELVQRDSGVAGAAGKLLVIVARAVMDGSWSRLKICSSSTCRWAFYDSSKNQSGRWCSMSACGSRLKAREYRKRRLHSAVA